MPRDNMHGGTLHFEAVIFDLDGVVTLTASVHAAAWKRTFDRFLEDRAQASGDRFEPFDLERDYLTYVDGKPRIEGVRSFLASRGIELPTGTPDDAPGWRTAWGIGNAKNEVFQHVLEEKGADVDEASVQFVQALHSKGVRTAVASSSKNCQAILRRAGLEDLFEVRVDGVVSEELGLTGKPNPDIFVTAAERLGFTPGKCVVVEDALAGVQAGRNGGFGLVIGIDRKDNRGRLHENGADLVLASFADTTVEQIDAWFLHRGDRRPSALGDWDCLVERLSGRRVAVFLDYDGTLTPIVSRPELAILPDGMREVVRELADTCPTAIVSGRGRDDVASLVQLDNVYMAGSHGFDIVGPEGTQIQYEVDESIKPVIAAVAAELEKFTAGIEGTIVEDKRFSVALHYRLVNEARIPELERIVDRLASEYPLLRKAHGKKVFELRPAIDWDKGRALLWLLEALKLSDKDVVPFYIGDDVTDEDAFVAIRSCGMGVVVIEAPRRTAAHYSLQNADEVREFLDRLTRYAKGIK